MKVRPRPRPVEKLADRQKFNSGILEFLIREFLLFFFFTKKDEELNQYWLMYPVLDKAICIGKLKHPTVLQGQLPGEIRKGKLDFYKDTD